jgi:hypothetical protein
MSAEDARAEDWKQLYPLLRSVLLQAGSESSFGDGDFWLVDDDWGGHLQKVCVFRIGFLTRRLVSDVQALLDNQFPDWGVMFQLEIKDSPESIPPEGLVVYADQVEEAWDAEQLARVFGKAFVFRFSS